MIYAHLAMNMREADCLFKCFIDERKNSIVKIKRTPFFYVKLLDGDEHCFMMFDTYMKWSIGQTYKLDGILYHSDFPQAEGGDDE